MTPAEAIELIKKVAFSVENEIEEIKASKFITALKTAISALEKQIPKKPIKSEKFLKSKHTVKVAVCPNCNSSLGLCNYAKTTFKYCGDCGQALDWSDTE